MILEIPKNAETILHILEKAGYEAYVVGGCVRDSILGRSPDDWDITTSAKPEQVKALFHRTVDTGLQHGTVTVLMEKEGYEVTTYRVDGEYEDGRHPKEVTFTASLEEDLKRRDFTINAMAYNPSSGLVDLFGGLEDIERRIIRCVGNPLERFTEDALRIMAKLLFQYYPDYTGSILFNGQQLRDIDRQSLYQRVGYIAQTTYLFNDTLRSNICLGADFPEAQLSHAIGTAGLTDWVSTLPDGLDTLISENGKNLSGGQRQRIGIARLALRRYDLIIADEITASLDPDTSGQIMENLLALPCMVVAITHDVSGAFMKQFDKVYRVEHGSVTQV